MKSEVCETAERSWFIAETFSYKNPAPESEYEAVLEFRHQKHNKPFMTVNEDGSIETIRDWGYIETIRLTIK